MKLVRVDSLLAAACACGLAFLLAIAACLGLIFQDSLSAAVSNSSVFVGPAVGCVMYAVMLLREASAVASANSA